MARVRGFRRRIWGGFVEHDEPAVGGAADSGAVRGLRVEEMGFVEGEVEEGAAR